jgi:hypothetical protein
VARTSPRRVSMPAAEDLFRPSHPSTEELAAEGHAGHVRAVPDPLAQEGPASRRQPSGRVRHDEKMTVYVTAEELIDLEHARLTLRRDHGLAVDRGRLVREAVALVLADLDDNGLDSMLVQRLTER